MEYLLPSEIARLVYGYLEAEKCSEAASIFLRTSQHLEECYQVSLKNRKFSTKVMGFTLLKCLDQFCAVHRLVQDRITTVQASDISSYDLVDQVAYLLEAGCKGHSTVMFNITVPVQEDANKTIDESATSLAKNVPSTPVKESNDKVSYSVSMEGSLSKPTWCITNTTPPQSNQSIVSSSPLIHEQTLPVPETTCLESLPGTTISEEKCNRRRNEAVPVPKVIEKAIQDEKLHERIANNINKVISTPEKFNQEKEKESSGGDELESVIKTIVSQTQKDPYFENFLDEFFVGAANCENVPDKISDEESKSKKKDHETEKKPSKNGLSKSKSKKSKSESSETKDGIVTTGVSQENNSKEFKPPESEITLEGPCDILASEKVNDSSSAGPAELVPSSEQPPVRKLNQRKKKIKTDEIVNIPLSVANNHRNFPVVETSSVLPSRISYPNSSGCPSLALNPSVQPSSTNSSIIVLPSTPVLPSSQLSVKAEAPLVPLARHLKTSANQPIPCFIKLNPPISTAAAGKLVDPKSIRNDDISSLIIAEEPQNLPKHGIYTKDIKPPIMLSTSSVTRPNFVNIAPKETLMSTAEEISQNTGTKDFKTSYLKTSSKENKRRKSDAKNVPEEGKVINTQNNKKNSRSNSVGSQKQEATTNCSITDLQLATVRTTELKSPVKQDSTTDLIGSVDRSFKTESAHNKNFINPLNIPASSVETGNESGLQLNTNETSLKNVPHFNSQKVKNNDTISSDLDVEKVENNKCLFNARNETFPRTDTPIEKDKDQINDASAEFKDRHKLTKLSSNEEMSKENSICNSISASSDINCGVTSRDKVSDSKSCDINAALTSHISSLNKNILETSRDLPVNKKKSCSYQLDVKFKIQDSPNLISERKEEILPETRTNTDSDIECSKGNLSTDVTNTASSSTLVIISDQSLNSNIMNPHSHSSQNISSTNSLSNAVSEDNIPMELKCVQASKIIDSGNKISSDFKKFVSPVNQNRTKKLSLSTPRNKSSHVRVLDFSTPPNHKDRLLRTAFTSPKMIFTGDNISEERFRSVCRSHLFESPSIKNASLLGVVSNEPLPKFSRKLYCTASGVNAESESNMSKNNFQTVSGSKSKQNKDLDGSSVECNSFAEPNISKNSEPVITSCEKVCASIVPLESKMDQPLEITDNNSLEDCSKNSSHNKSKKSKSNSVNGCNVTTYSVTKSNYVKVVKKVTRRTIKSQKVGSVHKHKSPKTKRTKKSPLSLNKCNSKNSKNSLSLLKSLHANLKSPKASNLPKKINSNVPSKGKLELKFKNGNILTISKVPSKQSLKSDADELKLSATVKGAREQTLCELCSDLPNSSLNFSKNVDSGHSGCSTVERIENSHRQICDKSPLGHYIGTESFGVGASDKKMTILETALRKPHNSAAECANMGNHDDDALSKISSATFSVKNSTQPSIKMPFENKKKELKLAETSQLFSWKKSNDGVRGGHEFYCNKKSVLLFDGKEGIKQIFMAEADQTRFPLREKTSNFTSHSSENNPNLNETQNSNKNTQLLVRDVHNRLYQNKDSNLATITSNGATTCPNEPSKQAENQNDSLLVTDQNLSNGHIVSDGNITSESCSSENNLFIVTMEEAHETTVNDASKIDESQPEKKRKPAKKLESSDSQIEDFLTTKKYSEVDISSTGIKNSQKSGEQEDNPSLKSKMGLQAEEMIERSPKSGDERVEKYPVLPIQTQVTKNATNQSFVCLTYNDNEKSPCKFKVEDFKQNEDFLRKFVCELEIEQENYVNSCKIVVSEEKILFSIPSRLENYSKTEEWPKVVKKTYSKSGLTEACPFKKKNLNKSINPILSSVSCKQLEVSEASTNQIDLKAVKVSKKVDTLDCQTDLGSSKNYGATTSFENKMNSFLPKNSRSVSSLSELNSLRYDNCQAINLSSETCNRTKSSKTIELEQKAPDERWKSSSSRKSINCRVTTSPDDKMDSFLPKNSRSVSSLSELNLVRYDNRQAIDLSSDRTKSLLTKSTKTIESEQKAPDERWKSSSSQKSINTLNRIENYRNAKRGADNCLPSSSSSLCPPRESTCPPLMKKQRLSSYNRGDKHDWQKYQELAQLDSAQNFSEHLNTRNRDRSESHFKRESRSKHHDSRSDRRKRSHDFKHSKNSEAKDNMFKSHLGDINYGRIDRKEIRKSLSLEAGTTKDQIKTPQRRNESQKRPSGMKSSAIEDEAICDSHFSDSKDKT